MPAKIVRLLSVLVLFGTVVGAADSSRVFTVGVLRRDSLIIPFATFDGKHWSKHWPLPNLELLVPVSTRDVPARWWGPAGPLERWQAWTSAVPQDVRVVQPDWIDVHCSRQVGLRTDYRSTLPVPPRKEQPYPKDGLAVSPATPIERIEIVNVESPEARALMPALTEAFNKSERLLEEQSGHPIARRAREGVEPTIEAVYAVGAAPRVYYVEASRPYRMLGQTPDECEALGFGTGWFVRDASAIQPLRMVVDLLRCDRLGASYMLPLGALRLGDQLFWVAQFSGWDHERYVVLEVKRKSIDVALSMWGGGC